MEAPRFQLAHGDAVAWLRSLPAGSVDLVVTDPPYESLEKHRAIGTTTRLKHSKASSNDWFSIFPNARFPELFAEVYRVLKKDTHFYLYCDPETMFVAKPMAEEAGFKFWKPIIWDKCLGPDTLVWTERGVVRIADIIVGDRVALPDGGTTRVRATRRTRAPSVHLHFSDGTSLIASRDHRFQREDGGLVEAAAIRVGDLMRSRMPNRDYKLSARLAQLTQLVANEPGVTRAAKRTMRHFIARAPEQRFKITASGESVSVSVDTHQPLGPVSAHASRRAAPVTLDHGWHTRPLEVVGIRDLGTEDLVDISIEHADELFVLANGVVTHNCKIGMGYHYRARYECILFFEKGKRKLNDLGIADILQAPRINGGYPAEKPPSISETLISQSTQAGELVIDPFMGSGSVGFAAITRGRHFMGNDLCKEAVDITRSRLLETHAQEAGRAEPAETGAKASAPQLGLTL
jgi:DNA modification methylase